MLKKLILLSAASLMAVPAVVAGHDELRPRELRVAQLAYELHEAALRLESDAFRRTRRGRSNDPVVLRSVDRLEDRARRFERALRRGRNTHVLDREFTELRRAYRSAAREMRFVRSKRLRGDFAEVSWLMQRLERKVDTVLYRRGHRGHRPPPVKPSQTHGSVRYGDRDGDLRVRVDW